MFAKEGNTKMAEGSDDPEGEESSEWFLPPHLSYILTTGLNTVELEFPLFLPLAACPMSLAPNIGMLPRLSSAKG
jgi:hypothetical protein